MNEVKMAYFVSSENFDSVDYESGISDKEFADLSKIRPLDPTHELKEARSSLGPVWNEKVSNVLKWGVKVHSDYLPKKYFLKGPKRPIADFKKMWGSALVSQKFKDLVETLEPETHQFFPVTLLWSDNSSPSGEFYFLNICNNIDGVNKSLSKVNPRKKAYSPKFETEIELSWRPSLDASKPDNFVMDRAKISDSHLWIDPYLMSNPRCTDYFRKRCEELELGGIKFSSEGQEVA